MHSATLQPREERRLLRGHPWAYRNEFKQLPSAEDGDLVDVFSAKRRFVGRGFYQARGGIAVRLLSARQDEVDRGFFEARIGLARAFRERLYPGETVYRWVFGESDGLPGLVADRYGAVVAAQSACGFYARHAEALVAAFMAVDGVAGVRLEVCGEVTQHGQVSGAVPCTLDGLDLTVDLDGGQKTGLFLDQRENMAAAARFAAGARVLDGHCYAGLWSCALARAGAAEVRGVDTSADAVARARDHAERNGVGDRCRFEEADVLAVLQRGGDYDLIVLDPPALAKSRAHAKKALGLYQALNTAAMKALAPGGMLVSCSCSHFVDAQQFEEMLKRAAAAAGRKLWLVECRGAAADHPVLLPMPETRYLTCAMLRDC